MVKLKFKRWWMYLRPSLRRWLKDCEKHLNSDEIQRKTDEAYTKWLSGLL